MSGDGPILAWWFSDYNHRLRYGDGRTAALGVTHSVPGVPYLCHHGLHGALSLLSALSYAPGPVLWRVELSGRIDLRDDKACGQQRKYISGGIDIEAELRAFAQSCALDVVDLWPAPGAVREWMESPDEAARRFRANVALENLRSPLVTCSEVAAAGAARRALDRSPADAGIGAVHKSITAQLHRDNFTRPFAAICAEYDERLTAMVTPKIDGGTACK